MFRSTHLPVLGYHEFAQAFSQDVYTVTPQVFAEQLSLLKSACAHRERATVTFDDAHVSQIHLALPVLEAAGVSAVFFVPTARAGVDANVATWPQLRELVRLGHKVESHSHTHPLLTHCSDSQLRHELQTSKHILEDQLGRACETISLPGGRGNARVLQACADAGYRTVYTSDPFSSRTASLAGARISIRGRLIVRRGVTPAFLAGFLTSDPRLLRRLRIEHQVKAAARTLMGDELYQLLWRRSLRRAPEAPALEGVS